MRKETIYHCEWCDDTYYTEAACREHEAKCYNSSVFKEVTVYEYVLRFDIYRGEYDPLIDSFTMKAKYDKEHDTYVIMEHGSVIPSYIALNRPSIYASGSSHYTARMYTTTPSSDVAKEALLKFANNYAKDCARRIVDRGLIKTRSASF